MVQVLIRNHEEALGQGKGMDNESAAQRKERESPCVLAEIAEVRRELRLGGDMSLY